MESYYLNIIEKFIESPSSIWSDGSLFHSRNISKIENVRGSISDVRDAAKDILSLLEERKGLASCNNIVITSCGSSGCHFAGSLFSAINKSVMINEVYIPSEFCSDPLLVDFVGYFHSRAWENHEYDVIPINVMHLRKDFDLSLFKKVNPLNKVYALIRDPYKVVQSLTFRKDDYRQLSAPGVDDLSYLNRRCRHVLNFHKLLESTSIDSVLRYESLVSEPYKILINELYAAKLPFSIQSLNETILANDKSRYDKGGFKSVNYNADKSVEIVHEEYKVLMKEMLSELADFWGYNNPF